MRDHMFLSLRPSATLIQELQNCVATILLILSYPQPRYDSLAGLAVAFNLTALFRSFRFSGIKFSYAPSTSPSFRETPPQSHDNYFYRRMAATLAGHYRRDEKERAEAKRHTDAENTVNEYVKWLNGAKNANISVNEKSPRHDIDLHNLLAQNNAEAFTFHKREPWCIRLDEHGGGAKAIIWLACSATFPK